MVEYGVPKHIQQTVINGMRAKALGETMGQIAKSRDSAPVAHEPVVRQESSESSGFWLFAVLAAIIIGIISLFTGSDSEGPETCVTPGSTAGPTES